MMKKQLTSSQIKAVTVSTDKHVVVTAVAGAGKTTVLEQRSKLLSKNGQTGQLIITFTKKAATNIVERIGFVPDSMFIGTFHAFCFNVLMEYTPTLIKGKFITEGQEFKLAIYASQAAQARKLRVAPKDGINRMNELFSLGIHPDDWTKQSGQTALNMLAYDIFTKAKKDGYMFFGELLIYTRDLLKSDEDVRSDLQGRYPLITVDEFQDTDDVQAEILQHMIGEDSHLFVVGDPAQAIYTWRGCNPQIIQNFEEYFGETERIVLDTNFRSSDEILDAANHLLEDMYSEHRMTGVKGQLKIDVTVAKYADPTEEAEYVAEEVSLGENPTDYAVLYRSNAQSGAVESELAKRKIPFRVSGNSRSFFDLPEVATLLAYLKLGQNIDDTDSLRYVWNRPTRFLKTEWLVKCAAKGDTTSALEIIRLVGAKGMGTKQRKGLNNLRHVLTHLHTNKTDTPSELVRWICTTLNYPAYLKDMAERSASRVEHDLIQAVRQFERIAQDFNTVGALLQHVVIAKNLQKQSQERNQGVSLSTIHSAKGLEFPNVFLIGAEEGLLPHEKTSDMDEERRLAYVAVTRAEEVLKISYYANPSRFIDKLRSRTSDEIRV